ncbi:MAG: family transporter [Bacteroidota bacterium]|nr:family transporter [Bacteroidota bacterium]
MQIRSKAYLQMHCATFLWGVTAILGKLISIREFPLVWYRMLIVCIFMLCMPSLYSSLKKVNKKNIPVLCGIGILIAMHWVAWYGAIKYANASVAVSCISCIAIFIAILEPIFNRVPFDRSNIILGLIVIPGIMLINQSLDLQYKFGFFLGMVAAMLGAIFTILNKKYTQDIEPSSITFIQMLCGFIFLTVCLPFYILNNPGNFYFPSTQDLILLVILSVVCTVIPYNLFLYALKKSDAFTTALVNNLEPVYGIILAVIILHENKELNWQFYLGTTIITSAVFIHAYLNRRKTSDYK